MVYRVIPLMLLAAVAATPRAIAQSLQPPAPPGPPVVVASGVATVKRAPDQAFVTFITESRAARPAEAQKLNAQAMAQVQEAVKRAGIPALLVSTCARTWTG